MFLVLAIVLFAAWILGWVVWHVASVGIHLLPAIAIVALIIHFVRLNRDHTPRSGQI